MNLNSLEYKTIIQKAIDKNICIKKDLDLILEKNIDNIFLVACGGSLAIMYPVKYILQIESTIPCFIFNAGEFNLLKPKRLNDRSLVLLISSSGNTPEIIEAARISKSKNCTTIGISARTKSSLAQEVDFSYNDQVENIGISEYKLIILYEFIFYILKKLYNFYDYNEIMHCLKNLLSSLIKIGKQAENNANKFAEEYKLERLFYIIGAGICWGQAYSFAVCKLEEMQWLTGQPIHAGEYFHGPFEVIDNKSNLIILKGEDLSRPLIDRVIAFSAKYSRNIEVIDTKDYSSLFSGISQGIKGYFSPFVLIIVLNYYSEALAKKRGHPLSIRRYMGKVDY